MAKMKSGGRHLLANLPQVEEEEDAQRAIAWTPRGSSSQRLLLEGREQLLLQMIPHQQR